MEPVIHDLISKGEDASFDKKNVLRCFIDPIPSIRLKVCDLYQPDGSTISRTLTEKTRVLPQFIMFDTIGQETFGALMRLKDEYYLTECEKSILRTKAKQITHHIPDNATIFDLGCGTMEKTKILIDHLRKSGKKGIKICGVDIDLPFLRTVLIGLMEDQKKTLAPGEDEFEFFGLHATYDQALPFMKKTKGPRVLLVMGSTIGGMIRKEATAFLHQFQKHSMDPTDFFYLGFDKRNDPKVVAAAYNDTKGHVHRIAINGLVRLDKIVGKNSRSLDNFKLVRGYNKVDGCNEVLYQSLKDQTYTIPPPYSGSDTESVDVHLKKDEYIDAIISYKYSQQEVEDVTSAAKFKVADQWEDPTDRYWFCLLKPQQSSN